MATKSLGILVSHPIQYYAPLFRELTKRLHVHVLYGQLADQAQQAAAGFGVGFEWDVDLMGGYASSVLKNVSKVPDVSTFKGCDVPTMKADLVALNLDAILIFGWYQKALVQGIWAAKRLGLPVMVRGDSHLATPRSSVKRFAKHAVYPALLRTFDAFLYVGHRSRAYYEHYGVPKNRLFFSPHCVETERFSKNATDAARQERRSALGVAPETPLVLLASKLLPLKRPMDLVHAVSKLRAQGSRAEVMIAGAGPLQYELERQARELGVPLHSLGFCNQSMMPSIYAAADALVLPSESETWGLVCNEALASGTPIVISSECGCAPDLAGDNNVGRVFPVGDISALANALADCFASPPSKEAIRALSDNYSVSRAADGITTAFAKLT